MNPNSFSIEKLPEGGFIVISERWGDHMPRIPLFASAEIDDALAFIKAKLTTPTTPNARDEG